MEDGLRFGVPTHVGESVGLTMMSIEIPREGVERFFWALDRYVQALMTHGNLNKEKDHKILKLPDEGREVVLVKETEAGGPGLLLYWTPIKDKGFQRKLKKGTVEWRGKHSMEDTIVNNYSCTFDNLKQFLYFVRASCSVVDGIVSWYSLYHVCKFKEYLQYLSATEGKRYMKKVLKKLERGDDLAVTNGVLRHLTENASFADPCSLSLMLQDGTVASSMRQILFAENLLEQVEELLDILEDHEGEEVDVSELSTCDDGEEESDDDSDLEWPPRGLERRPLADIVEEKREADGAAGQSDVKVTVDMSMSSQIEVTEMAPPADTTMEGEPANKENLPPPNMPRPGAPREGGERPKPKELMTPKDPEKGHKVNTPRRPSKAVKISRSPMNATSMGVDENGYYGERVARPTLNRGTSVVAPSAPIAVGTTTQNWTSPVPPRLRNQGRRDHKKGGKTKNK